MYGRFRSHATLWVFAIHGRYRRAVNRSTRPSRNHSPARSGQVIEYVITDADAAVPNDRVRAYALWEGWHGYDRKKYSAMLREAFEPFEQIATDHRSPTRILNGIGAGESSVPQV
jgi:hypothetical protein